MHGCESFRRLTLSPLSPHSPIQSPTFDFCAGKQEKGQWFYFFLSLSLFFFLQFLINFSSCSTSTERITSNSVNTEGILSKVTPWPIYSNNNRYYESHSRELLAEGVGVHLRGPSVICASHTRKPCDEQLFKEHE